MKTLIMMSSLRVYITGVRRVYLDEVCKISFDNIADFTNSIRTGVLRSYSKRRAVFQIEYNSAIA